MNRFFPIVSLFFFTIVACKKEGNQLKESHNPNIKPEIIYDHQSKLKLKFGQALASALNENIGLRNIIKEEALRMFDKDYDVLYHLIKDKITSNNLTVRELILNYFENKEQLSEIEAEIPTLTILVPSLPHESFSAELWNTQIEKPHVAIRMNNTENVPVIKENGESYIIENGAIPGFPIVVIKENERVICTNRRASKINQFKGSKFYVKDNLSFQFIDDAFNGLNKRKRNNPNAPNDVITDGKIKNAYEIYKNVDGWHRDYIYYNLTPDNTKGEFDYNYQETLVSFSLKGDPRDTYPKISDQTEDPVKKNRTYGATAGWTGGFYEFKVKLLFNAKNGVGSEFETYFPAKPEDLFDTEYKKITPFNLYRPIIKGHKTFQPNLKLFHWDLNQYASTIKIEIEEVDQVETIQVQESRTVDFATNFGIDGKVLKKIGLKFGASLQKKETQSTTKTYTKGNDQLGAVLINFADNMVVKSKHRPRYYTRKHSSGWFYIGVRPTKVQ